MMWYVPIKRIKGMHDYCALIDHLNSHGFADRVEYHPGGWDDCSTLTMLPHLKFEASDDAIAYVLAFGGTVHKDLPVLHNN